MSLPTSQVYSVCVTLGADDDADWQPQVHQYNFDDLNGLLPYNAWNCQPYCSQALADYLPGDSSTFIVDGATFTTMLGGYCGVYPNAAWYKPWVIVPPQIRTLNAAWATCALQFEGWYDPPTALPHATTVQGPITPAHSATPAPQPTPSIVPSTTTAVQSTSPPSSGTYSIEGDSQSSTSMGQMSTSSSSTKTSEVLPPPSVVSSTLDPESPNSSQAQSSHFSSTMPHGEQPGASNTADPGDTSSANTGNPSSGTYAPPAGNTGPSGFGASEQGTARLTIDPSSAGQSGPSSLPESSSRNVGGAVVSAISALFGASQQTDPVDPSANSTPTIGGTPSGAQDLAASGTAGDPTVARPSPSSGISDPQPASTIEMTFAGVTYTIAPDQSSGAAVFDGSTVKVGGSPVVINSQTISAGTQGVYVGTSLVLDVLGLEMPPSSETPSDGSMDPAGLASAMVISGEGVTFTAIRTAGSIILADSSFTTTMAQGMETTFEGQTVNILSDGSGVVFGGSSTVAFAPTLSSEVPSAVITTGGQTLTAVQHEGFAVFGDGSSTLTVADGSHATFAGETVAVAPNGNGVIIGGSSIPLSVNSIMAGTASRTASGTNTIGGASAVTHASDAADPSLSPPESTTSASGSSSISGSTIVFPSLSTQRSTTTSNAVRSCRPIFAACGTLGFALLAEMWMSPSTISNMFYT